MFETSGLDGDEAGLLLPGECGVEGGDVYPEDEAKDRLDQGETHLQPEARNSGAGLWEYLFHIGAGSIYASREEESKHPVVALLCRAQSIQSASIRSGVCVNGTRWCERVVP